MKSYSEDLRKKIVAVVERAMSNSETVRLFGVSLSSVKRSTSGWPEQRGVPCPQEQEARHGSEGASEHAEAFERGHHKERPAVIIAQRIRFLHKRHGEAPFSYSTIRGVFKRLGGWSRRKDRWEHRSRTSG